MNAPAAAVLPAPLLSLSLIGVPNCGKTALFNRLTGSRQKVANYPGVTVERKEGRLVGPRTGRSFRVVDLPGAYSLEPATLDEAIARDVVLGRHASEPAPDLLVCVVDATNLRLGLRLVLELKRLGRPMIVALNMSDLAAQRGYHLDRIALERALGIPVIPTVAVKNGGERALLEAIDNCDFSAAARARAHARLEAPSASAADIEATQREVRRVLQAAAYRVPARVTALARLDQVVLHPVAGPALLAAVLFLMFQAVFSWAKAPQNLINEGVQSLNGWLAGVLPAGPLRGLLLDGVIAGAGSVLVFLPQILILFAFILALEDSGYLPRAAFMLDRLMGRVGLSGRAFIPLLSSFACAIPGIMAARTIPARGDRLATIMIAPLMTCSARLPVYALLIGAFIPRALRRLAEPEGPGAVRAVRRRRRERARGRLRHEAHDGARGIPAAAAGAARIPPAAPHQPHRGTVGARQDLPDARRHHHPEPDGGVVVPRELPRAAGRGAADLRSSTASPAISAAASRCCSRPSALTGRSRSRWCPDLRRARWR